MRFGDAVAQDEGRARWLKAARRLLTQKCGSVRPDAHECSCSSRAGVSTLDATTLARTRMR